MIEENRGGFRVRPRGRGHKLDVQKVKALKEQGLTHNEIARRFSVHVKTVENTLRRAKLKRNQFREKLTLQDSVGKTVALWLMGAFYADRNYSIEVIPMKNKKQVAIYLREV